MTIDDEKDNEANSAESDEQPVVPKERKSIDVQRLKQLAESMPYQNESAGDFIRRMRDSERY